MIIDVGINMGRKDLMKHRLVGEQQIE
jgi:hypothetical protein